MINVGRCAPRPLELPKTPSNQPIGTMQINVTTPTIPIGISRSVIGNVSALPDFRARDAAIAPANPLINGFASLTSVQIAETPIAPAPMYLTLPLQALRASAATGVVKSLARAE